MNRCAFRPASVAPLSCKCSGHLCSKVKQTKLTSIIATNKAISHYDDCFSFIGTHSVSATLSRIFLLQLDVVDLFSVQGFISLLIVSNFVSNLIATEERPEPGSQVSLQQLLLLLLLLMLLLLLLLLLILLLKLLLPLNYYYYYEYYYYEHYYEHYYYEYYYYEYYEYCYYILQIILLLLLLIGCNTTTTITIY